MNKCEQTSCMANHKGSCIYYREPIWEGFATEECCGNVNEMFRAEDEYAILEGEVIKESE